MLRIYLADDDRIIRMGLRALISAHPGGHEIVGEATNGFDALAALETLGADLLFTDIKMPVMDGLELIRTLRSRNRRIRIIVLSGFDEFRFVQESLRQGVTDYLLKPLDKEALAQLLDRMNEEIEAENARNHARHTLAESVSQNMPVLREKGLVDLLQGSGAETPALRQCLGSLLDACPVHVAATIAIDGLDRTDASDTERFIRLQQLRERTATFLPPGGEPEIVLTHQGERIRVLFSSRIDDAAHLMRRTEELLRSLVRHEADEDRSITAGFGMTARDTVHIRQSFDMAEAALRRRFLEGTGTVYGGLPAQPKPEALPDAESFRANLQELENALEIEDAHALHHGLSRLFERLSRQQAPEALIRSLLREAVERFRIVVRDFPEAENLCFSQGQDLTERIQAAETWPSLQRDIKAGLRDVLDRMGHQRRRRSKRSVELAKEFIQRHYAEDICLKAVADHVHLNPTYLSELFRQETGTTFIDYLIDTRILKAKKLIAQPDMKVGDAGRLVGYPDPVSFNRAFKKVVGISPTEFKKIIR